MLMTVIVMSACGAPDTVPDENTPVYHESNIEVEDQEPKQEIAYAKPSHEFSYELAEEDGYRYEHKFEFSDWYLGSNPEITSIWNGLGGIDDFSEMSVIEASGDFDRSINIQTAAILVGRMTITNITDDTDVIPDYSYLNSERPKPSSTVLVGVKDYVSDLGYIEKDHDFFAELLKYSAENNQQLDASFDATITATGTGNSIDGCTSFGKRDFFLELDEGSDSDYKLFYMIVYVEKSPRNPEGNLPIGLSNTGLQRYGVEEIYDLKTTW
jgi:hypothetical protein